MVTNITTRKGCSINSMG